MLTFANGWDRLFATTGAFALWWFFNTRLILHHRNKHKTPKHYHVSSQFGFLGHSVWCVDTVHGMVHPVLCNKASQTVLCTVCKLNEGRISIGQEQIMPCDVVWRVIAFITTMLFGMRFFYYPISQLPSMVLFDNCPNFISYSSTRGRFLCKSDRASLLIILIVENLLTFSSKH